MAGVGERPYHLVFPEQLVRRVSSDVPRKWLFKAEEVPLKAFLQLGTYN